MQEKWGMTRPAWLKILTIWGTVADMHRVIQISLCQHEMQSSTETLTKVPLIRASVSNFFAQNTLTLSLWACSGKTTLHKTKNTPNMKGLVAAGRRDSSRMILKALSSIDLSSLRKHFSLSVTPRRSFMQFEVFQLSLTHRKQTDSVYHSRIRKQPCKFGNKTTESSYHSFSVSGPMCIQRQILAEQWQSRVHPGNGDLSAVTRNRGRGSTHKCGRYIKTRAVQVFAISLTTTGKTSIVSCNACHFSAVVPRQQSQHYRKIEGRALTNGITKPHRPVRTSDCNGIIRSEPQSLCEELSRVSHFIRTIESHA